SIPVTSGQVMDLLDIDDGVWELRISATDFARNSSYAASGAFDIMTIILAESTITVNGAPEIEFSAYNAQPVITPLVADPQQGYALQADIQGLGFVSTIYDVQPEGVDFVPPATMVFRYADSVVRDLGIPEAEEALHVSLYE
ncbi:MAG: hypothetical protein ABIP48_05800, partial [Planctomycetota bacterium]